MVYLKHFWYFLCHALSKLGLLKYFNFTITKKTGNRSLRIPIVNGIGYYNLMSTEHWFEQLLPQLIDKKKGIFLDVGVNLGQTIVKLEGLDPEIAYIGFEPNPVCYNYSRQLLLANNLTNKLIYPVGLSDKTEIVRLFGNNEIASGASIIADFRTGEEFHKVVQIVPVMKGDEVLEPSTYNAIGLIKVDVEGAELEVLKGLEKVLNLSKPNLVVEILPVYTLTNENGIKRKRRQDELLTFLKRLGYQLYLINENTATLSKLEDIEVHGDMGRTNYLFVHDSKQQILNN